MVSWQTRRVTDLELSEIADGVFVTMSSFAMTRSTVVAGADGSCLLIDPGVTVAEMVALATVLQARGLRPVVGWSTHPHWDHVLWHRSLGIGVPRYAAPGHDLALFGKLVPLDGDSIPWDGPRAELVILDAHAPGHGAVFLPETGVLVAGDMVSDVEIPLLDTEAADAMGDYRTGLTRLAAVPGVGQVVPGHGHVGDASEFGRRVAADTAYLDRLARGEPFDEPRITQDWLRTAHEDHLRYVRRLRHDGHISTSRLGGRFGRIRIGGRGRLARVVLVLVVVPVDVVFILFGLGRGCGTRPGRGLRFRCGRRRRPRRGRDRRGR